MNRSKIILVSSVVGAAVAIVLLGVLCSTDAFAAPQAPPVAPSIGYQGQLTDPSSGAPVDDGVYTMTFSIYNSSTGSTPLWTQTSAVTVTDGLFNVELGDISNPIDAVVFPGGPRWLGVQVDPDPEMMPRQLFHSVPYAVLAESLRSGGTTSDTSSNALYTLTNNGSGPALVAQGDVHIDGNLSWYTRTGYVSVAPAAFIPDDETYQYNRDTGASLLQDSPSSGSYYYAPVSLPHGATVTKFTVYYFDDSSGTIMARLRYSNMGTGTYAMAEALSADGGYGSTDDTSIDYAQVDNETRAYYVRVQFPASAYSGTLNFKGVVIEYQYSEPY
jgi:hypothetical protein